MNPVLYVVIIADSDQTVRYELRLFSETYRFYIKLKNALINLLRQASKEDKWVLSRIMDDFTCPSFTLSVFWVSPVGYSKHGDTPL